MVIIILVIIVYSTGHWAMVRIMMRIFQVLEPPQSEDGDDSATGGLSDDYKNDYKNDDNGDFSNAGTSSKTHCRPPSKGLLKVL